MFDLHLILGCGVAVMVALSMAVAVRPFSGRPEGKKQNLLL